MKHNRFGYFFKEGVNSIFTHAFMSFASISIIVACLIIMGSFTLLTLNVKSMIQNWESQNQILAFVDETLNDAQAKALITNIKAIPNVSEAVFVSKDEALKSYLSQFGENDLFKGIDSSVLRHRYVINLKDIGLMSDSQKQIGEIKGIVKVNAHLEISQGFVTISRIVSTVSVIIITILLLISIFIMSNTIKLATFDRREEIAIMKMVGATNGFIRWPFVFEGLILGFVGALIAFLVQWAIYYFLTIEIAQSSTMKLIETVPFGQLAVPLLLIFIGTGFVVGIGGSLTVIRKYLQV